MNYLKFKCTKGNATINFNSIVFCTAEQTEITLNLALQISGKPYIYSYEPGGKTNN